MERIFSFFTRNQSIIYKVSLYVVATVLVIYLLPKGGQFKYNIQKGKPWQYENYYAPFNFTIKKDEKTLEDEIQAIRNQATPFFEFDTTLVAQANDNYQNYFEASYNDTLMPFPRERLYEYGDDLMEAIYQMGVVSDNEIREAGSRIYLKRGASVRETTFDELFQKQSLAAWIERQMASSFQDEERSFLGQVVLASAIPNVFYDDELTATSIEQQIQQINPNQGIIEKGVRIIARGEVVEGEKYQILKSLEQRYRSDVWSQANYFWVVLGYTILVSLVFIMLLLFLKKYRPSIYENNTKVSFIFFNIVFMVFITTVVIKYNASFVYVVPLPILPIVLKSFFDARLGLYVHVLTLLLLGFVVPNSFEFLFLQIIAGIVTILTVSELSKRANLFISVGQITFVYVVGYFAFFIIQEGDIKLLQWDNFTYFLLCGLITLFAFPLIYAYEKVFGLVSEVSLLELSNTNSPLLKELSDKAPGTFHHSLNVANLSEAAAQEIGADSMLVRVGALYHDIGKIPNAVNFTENQVNAINPLDELAPKESAQIIIDHVIKGIEIARKYKLPDRVVDFIRTHHGTNLVYYFYRKELDRQGEADEAEFRYPGPKPFSRETAILMMADSVEAASRSLKEPNSTKIDQFVEGIVGKQMEQGQFENANITFKEIEQIKKILKKKLNNSFHLRVEYPE